MSPHFKLWSCPYFSLEEKEKIDPIGLSADDQILALQSLLKWMKEESESESDSKSNLKIQDQIPLFKKWIDQHPDVDLFSNQKEGLFNLALKTKSDELISFFLTTSSCPSANDLDQWLVSNGIHRASKKIIKTPLLNYFTENNLMKSLKSSLKKGLNVNVKDEFGDTPLHMVKSVEATELLLKYNASTSVKNAQGHYPEVFLFKNNENKEKMKHLILSARAKQVSDKKKGFMEMEQKLFSSIWQDDAIQFNAYLNALAHPIESFIHPNQKVNLLVWAIRRRFASSSADMSILKKIIHLWPTQETVNGKDLDWSDKKWIWMAFYSKHRNGSNPCREYWKSNHWSDSNYLDELVHHIKNDLKIGITFTGYLNEVWESSLICFIQNEFLVLNKNQGFLEIREDRFHLLSELTPLLNEKTSEFLTSALSSYINEILANSELYPEKWSVIAGFWGELASHCKTNKWLEIQKIDCSNQQAKALIKHPGFIGWENHYPQKANEILAQGLAQKLEEKLPFSPHHSKPIRI